MTHAIVVRQHGGSEVLEWEEAQTPPPLPDEVRIRHTAIGLNFIDVYFRSGLYPPGILPFTPGMEAAGVIEAVGENVTDFAIGQRVAYAGGPLGAYAEARNFPAERLVRIPDGIGDEEAAAMMLKGMTAEYLLCSTYRVKAGETILVHAAAGGVGQILCQWAASIGAEVIGTVGSEEKAEIAKARGCRHVIDYRRESVPERIRQITRGAGVPVVYDSVGKDTFEGSLASLAPMGLLVSFGQSSGKIPPFDPGELSRRGSLYLTRPTLFDYTRTRPQLLQSSQALFGMIGQGRVRISIEQRYPLSEAARAHCDLEQRRTRGSSILLP